MAEHGVPQFLLSCLPSNKNYWRAGSNRREMLKPNAIVREYVMSLLKEPNSGYREALKRIDEYAKERRTKEDLSGEEYRALIKNGKEQMIEECMNGVYSILKNIPDSEREVLTPMMSAMSMNYEDMASFQEDDPMIEFGFKLRSYSNRLEHHKKEMIKYHDARVSYENTKNVSEDSKPLYEFFKFEEEYNAKLMCKYRHFLSFLPPDTEYEDDFKSLMAYKNKVRNMSLLLEDKNIKRMQSDNAEDYARKVYDLNGGSYMVTNPNILESRYNVMQNTYDKMEEDFKYKLSMYGLSLDDKGVSRKKPYEFDEVKALDLHHLGYDWTYDIDVSRPNVEEFISYANKRHELFRGAKNYLEASGQSAQVVGLPEVDIKIMKELADKMTVNPVLSSNVSGGGSKPRRKTVRLDADYTKNIKLAVEATTHSTMQFSDYE